MTHPDEEYSHIKALKRHNDMLGFVADAQYGVPTKCPCGGGIIPEDEVTKLVDRVKEMAEEIDRLKAQLYQLHRP
ncbi:hypothetical protein IGI04_025418 [Brassica rapa subsp. trilocularis]|uniref:Uncharacterized protein n=1 Tax=Brassica rapa subsp. trilocularis TaxID=1813537 RepID=A0ABQ7KSY1_BRACM|nr:hypothetical protein IGI04_025415 [Brassica rapa subsp. trilocularis]KAG5377576.1 hypothetical protein IGI04_025418 [Brassica rapa subsp. trilocularis]